MEPLYWRDCRFGGRFAHLRLPTEPRRSIALEHARNLTDAKDSQRTKG